ncbi:MAG: hypothetical protein ACREBG_20625, partial [Pyrinomonadaceae bacterium]
RQHTGLRLSKLALQVGNLLAQAFYGPFLGVAGLEQKTNYLVSLAQGRISFLCCSSSCLCIISG